MTDQKQPTNEEIRQHVWALIAARAGQSIEKLLGSQPILAEVWLNIAGAPKKMLVQEPLPFKGLEHLRIFAMFQNEDEIRCYALSAIIAGDDGSKIAPHRITISKLAPHPMLVLEQMAMQNFVDLVAYELSEEPLPDPDAKEDEDEDDEEEAEEEDEDEEEAAEEPDDASDKKRRRALDG